MARRSFDAKLQVVANGSSASTSVTSASSSGIGDLTIDESRAVTEIASRGVNQKRAMLGLQSVIISGSCEADAAAVSVLDTANRAASEVYAKFSFADGSSVSGVFLVTKFSADDPVEGEERRTFELQPSAQATPDANGNVITYAAAPTSNQGGGGAA